jgi:D-amino peptidase
MIIALAVVSRSAAQSPPPGWSWTPVAPATGPLRVLITYDMEGLSGVDRIAMVNCAERAAYAIGQDRLAADVNAVVEGLAAAGAAKIEVIDRHGSGCDDTPDLPVSRLDRRATYVDEKGQALFPRIMERQWDAVLLVGAHASPGWNGFMEHVGSFGIERIINGVSISESEQHAQVNGSGGIPVVFASGDDRLCAQLKQRLPWVTCVVVKRATSRLSAALRPPSDVRADLIAGVKAAVANRDHAMVVSLTPPYTGAYKPVWPLTLEPLTGIAGIDISEGFIRVSGSNPREVNQAINRISDLVAGAFTADAHWAAVKQDKARDRFRDSLFMVRWQAGPPVKPSSPP